MKQKLRIAQFVTASWTQPKPAEVIYASIDLMLEITKKLSQRGHEMTIFAPEGSHPSFGKLETLGVPPLEQDKSTVYHHPGLDGSQRNTVSLAYKQYFIQHMFKAAVEGKFDLLHIHCPDFSLPLARAYPTVPVLYTLHDEVEWRHVLYTLLASPNQWFASISNAQRRPAPQLQYANTIYNGIEIEKFPFSEKPGQYLLYVGRIMSDKGVAEAIQVAKALGEELKIVGPVSAGPNAPKDYWEKEIRPQLTDTIQHVGTINRSELYKYYQNAKALLMPIKWEEPFGLVMAEAMACGTPVIGFRRGSVPEVVADGETGFVVDTVEEMVTAVKKVDSIARRTCRERVEKKFTMEKMIDGYEQAYYNILGRS